MSGTVDLEAQLVRIARAREETATFSEETRKFVAEAHKLDAEAAKLYRDRFLSPLLAAGIIAGAIGGLVAGVLAVLRLIEATS